MQRILITLGAALLILGLIWPYLARLGLGHLPGDIAIERDGLRFYFPLTTCLLLSVVASLLFWLFRKL
jgi:hypothetical protein